MSLNKFVLYIQNMSFFLAPFLFSHSLTVDQQKLEAHNQTNKNTKKQNKTNKHQQQKSQTLHMIIIIFCERCNKYLWKLSKAKRTYRIIFWERCNKQLWKLSQAKRTSIIIFGEQAVVEVVDKMSPGTFPSRGYPTDLTTKVSVGWMAKPVRSAQ